MQNAKFYKTFTVNVEIVGNALAATGFSSLPRRVASRNGNQCDQIKPKDPRKSLKDRFFVVHVSYMNYLHFSKKCLLQNCWQH